MNPNRFQSSKLKYILIRHGESTANVDRAVREHINEHDIPLTEIGEIQAKEAALELKNHHLKGSTYCMLTSPYTRARATAKIIAETLAHKNPIVPEVRLRELDYGDAHIMRTKEERQKIKQDIAKCGGLFYYQYPNGESYTTLLTRLSTLHNELLGGWRETGCPEHTIIMVAHAHVLAAWDVLLTGKEPNTVDYRMKNCCIRTYIKMKGSDFQLV